MTGLARLFSFGSCAVRVCCSDAEQLAWVEEFLSPSFEVASGGRADLEVRVEKDSRLFREILAAGPDGGRVDAFVFDSKTVRLPTWRTCGGGCLVRDEDFHTFYRVDHARRLCRIITPHDNDLLVRTPIMRVVRETVMTKLRQDGGLFLHSSAFELDGSAVLIAGPTTAGKTTTLIYMLQAARPRFIANDRVFVREDGGRLQARGMPTVLTIRQSTLDVLPAAAAPLLREGYNFRMNASESRQRGRLPQAPRPGGEFGLNPRQFCSWLNVEPRGAAPVGMLLCPVRTGRPGTVAFEAPGIEEAVDTLQHALFGLHDWQGISRLFDFFGGSPPARERLIETCTSFARAVPAYRCLLGTDSLRSTDTAARIRSQLAASKRP